MTMRRMSTPAPTPMPILVARLGPLSGEPDGTNTGGATGRLNDADEEGAGATKDLESVELRDDEKDVVVTASEGESVIELTEVVDCCKLVLGATDVDASKAEDIEDR